jgi:hypothetical protein
MSSKNTWIGITAMAVVVAVAFYSLTNSPQPSPTFDEPLASGSEKAAPAFGGLNTVNERVGDADVSSPSRLSLRNGGGVAINELIADGRASLKLPSGGVYNVVVNTRDREADMSQLYVTIDPDGTPGFGLITIKNQYVVGTFNTPEGVYELFGAFGSEKLMLASEVDGARRQGVDYKKRPLGTVIAVPTEGKKIQLQ